MNKFRNQPLKTKLVVIIMSASIIAIVSGLATYLVFDMISIKNDMKKNALLNADLLGQYSVVPLLFDYKDDAKEVLAKLNTMPSVSDACIYDSNGEIFSYYHKDPDKSFSFPEPKTIEPKFTGGYLHVYHKINFENRDYGTLYIRLSASAIQEKFVRKLFVIIILIIVLILPVYLTAIHLQKIISKPILELAERTNTISHNQDFSLQLKPYGNDEIGFLYQQFNNLLSQILKRQIERDKAEKEISFLAEVLKNINENVCITDLEDNIIFVNQSFLKTYEFSEKELIGQNISIVRSADNIPKVVDEILPLTMKGGWQGELLNRKKDGSVFPVWLFTTIIRDKTNQPSAFVGISTDITERKKAENELIQHRDHLEELVKTRTAELENFFTVALDLLCITDTSCHFIRVNKAWDDILGYSISDLEGRHFLDFVHPDDVQLTLDCMGTLNNQHAIREFTIRYRKKDGSYRFIEWHSVPVGNTIYAAARDITERIKVEEALKKSRLEADQANTAKSEFLSRMSHELRTPMNSILGFAQLMQMGELTASQAKGISHIMRSGKHLLDLINEVLDISRIEAGRISLSLEPVLVENVVKEIIDIVKPLAQERKITIGYENSGTSRIFVNSDHQRLKQILINLMNNAIKYNHEGGNVKINISMIQPDIEDITNIRIAITDTGHGIASEDLPKLFKPFERIGADKTTTEGTGLGLAVVEKLTNVLGGKIGVESEVGKGSTFWIEMPQCEGQIEKVMKSGEIDDNLIQVHDKKGTILYIEDNTSNIELIEQILEAQRSNIRLITNMTGQQTVGLALEYKPDLILLDLNLPDMHGSEVLENLRANLKTNKIPVVVISADAMPKQLDKLLKSGAKNYITKPIQIAEFLKIVDEFIPDEENKKS
ncbi:MAG: PAS domain S-box protein [Bacteroidales bacterium]|nr:PAS domain S-box protein [Bacteroidales bacterium]